jgi:hypothetical protein
MLRTVTVNNTMIMKMSIYLVLVLLTAGTLILPCGQAAAPAAQDEIAVARSAIKADRKATVTEVLQLTPTEAEKFWPLYQQYRAEMDQVADKLVKLVKEYAGYYPNVPEDRARQMLKDLTGLEKKQLALRASFLRKFGKVLPADKTLRFAQVENRLDLAVRLQLAATIPLVPVEGEMGGTATASVAYATGTPGGTFVQTYQVKATVAAIDKATRKVTLVNAAGIKKTVKAGPEIINFDQIRVGDQLKVLVAQELVVSVAGEGETPTTGTGQVVALAPKGAKPGGIMADTTQVTAKVTAIDNEHHLATLQFEDGTTKTVPVRPDVDLSKRKVGDKVVIRMTDALAIGIERP